MEETSGKPLTDGLASRIMGWKPCPDRFVKSGRSWIPRWRFQPLTQTSDAFQLLNSAAGSLILTTGRDGTYRAEVRFGAHVGRAAASSVATSITVAVARAIGLDVPDEVIPSLASIDHREKRDGQPR
jgi:hypothetical protein